MVTLKQLETLYWVARLRTFQSAADRLNATQSAVSKRLQELESAMGFPLFDRQQRTLRLTPRSEELLRLAEEVLQVVDRISSLKSNAAVVTRRFRFGVTELAALTWLAPAVVAMQEKFPDVNIEPEVAMTRTLHASLMNGTIDLAVFHDALPELNFVTRPLAEVRNDFLGSPQLLQGRKFKTFEQITDFTLIHLGPNSWSGLAFNRWLHARDIEFRRTIPCNSLSTAIRLISLGAGISALPSDCLASMIDDGKLVRIDVEPRIPPAPFSIMYRDNASSAMNREMADIIEELCDFSIPISAGIQD